MQRIQNIRSRRLLVDELIRAIQHIESQSSAGIAEMSSSIQENVDRLKGLIELNKYDDSTVKKNIDQTRKELDTQIKELKQMISDHNKRAEENAHSINQMRSAVEGEIQKLKAQPKEIVQKVDTSTIEEELKRQKENQKVIAEYVKAHQEEQKKSNDQFQASLDRLIAEFLNSQKQPKPEPVEMPDYTKQFEAIDNRLLTVEQRGVPARMTPSFAHLEQNYYKKPEIEQLISSSAGGGGGTGTVFGEPKGIAYFAGNSALASQADEMRFDFDTNTLLIGTSAALKESKIYAQSNYTGLAPNYGIFLAESWAPTTDSTALVGGLGFTVQTNGDINFSGQVKGIEGFVFHAGSGYLAQALGAGFLVQNNGGGRIGAAFGASFAVQNNSTGGIIDLATALYAGPPTASGPISLNFGIEIDNQGGTPNVSNAVGVYLKNQTGAAGINYALYSEGGAVGWNQNSTNSDFQIKGQSDANTFYLDASQNAVGIGVATPTNKFDVAGSVAIGSAYAGTNVAPSQGLLVAGNVAIGTTDYSSIPGASATVFSIVSRVDSANNSAHGGTYFRTIMGQDNQETFGNYNLVSTSGMTITSGTHILGIQNEIYLQNIGNSAAFDNANGVLNFMEANGAGSHAIGVNNIIYGTGNNTQTIGMVNIMPISEASGTHVGAYSLLQSTNSSSTGLIGGYQAAMNWASPSATILGASVSAFAMGTVNNPTQKQVGFSIDWNVPGTDTSFAKWGLYVNSSQVDSAKAYFGDSVMLGKKPYVAVGTNKPMGVVTLTGGTANVSANTTTNSTVIMATVQIPGGTVGSIYVAGRTAGTGFTLTSTSGTDTSEVAYMMYERTP